MLMLLDPPGVGKSCPPAEDMDPKELEQLIAAMGKRLQAEYVAGAIPYLKRNEPELWAELEALDREETLAALLRYERLFFEGLRRYCDYLSRLRKAA
jgi:hypothetical protein